MDANEDMSYCFDNHIRKDDILKDSNIIAAKKVAEKLINLNMNLSIPDTEILAQAYLDLYNRLVKELLF